MPHEQDDIRDTGNPTARFWIYAFIVVMLIVALLVAINVATAKEGVLKWDEEFGGGQEDRGRAVVEAHDGGYVIVGDTASKGAGDRDVWIIKIDVDGEHEWDKTFGTTYEDLGFSITATSDGGYLIAGYTASGSNRDDRDLWLIKIDSNGSKEWDRTYGGAEQEEGRSVVEVSTGGFIIVGSTSSYGQGKLDLWVLRTDENGTELWNMTYGWPNRDEGRQIIEASDGGFAIAARGEPVGAANLDMWLVKIASDGAEEWNETWGGSKMDEAWSIAEADDGSFISTGRTYSYGKGTADMILVKVDSDGGEVWVRTYGDANAEQGRFITNTTDNEFLITGRTKSYGSGDHDFWLLKVDENGTELLNRTYGGSGWDDGRGICIGSDGGYAVVGWTGSYGSGGDDLWLLGVEGEYDTVNHLPEVDVASHSNYEEVEGPVVIEGTAYDEDGNGTIVNVTVSMNDGQWTDAVGTTSWAHSWNASSHEPGTHTFRIAAHDGQVLSNITTLYLEVPNNPPNLDITHPPGDTNLSGLVNITGTASDPDHSGQVTEVLIGIDNHTMVKVNGIYDWNYLLNTTNYQDGAHRIRIRATDGQLETEVKIDATFLNTPENSPPSVSIISPLPGTVNGTVILTGIAADVDGNETITKVQVSRDGTSWTDVTGTDNWAYSWKSKFVEDGNHTLWFRATDGIAISNLTSITLFVDNVPPVLPPSINITSPFNGSVVRGLIWINGTSTDPNGNDTIKATMFIVDGESIASNSFLNIWSFELNTTDLDDGTYVVKLNVSDKTKQTATANLTLIVDNIPDPPVNNTAPAVLITAPSSGTTVRGTVNISGIAWDKQGADTIKWVKISIEEGQWIEVDGIAEWTYVLDTTKYDEGSLTIEVRAYDGWSYSTINTITLYVDNDGKRGGTPIDDDGRIPGFEVTYLLVATLAGILLLTDRRKR